MRNRVVAWFGLIADRRGVTALEYGLIAALVSGVIATAVGRLGTNLTAVFGRLASSV